MSFQRNRSTRSELGATAVETSLVILLFLVITFAMIDLGRALTQRVMLGYAAYRSARAGAMHAIDCEEAARREYTRLHETFPSMLPTLTDMTPRVVTLPGLVKGFDIQLSTEIRCLSCRLFLGGGTSGFRYTAASFYPFQIQEGSCATTSAS